MIIKRLQSAIEDLDALIALTKSDIEDIKEAKHDRLSSRLSEKEALIESFEHKKSLLNSELLKLTKLHEGKSMEDILDSDATEALDLFKEKLSSLKAVNKEYARFVASISEFYNSLIDKMFTLQRGDRYEKTKLSPASIFAVSA